MTQLAQTIQVFGTPFQGLDRPLLIKVHCDVFLRVLFVAEYGRIVRTS